MVDRIAELQLAEFVGDEVHFPELEDSVPR